MATKKWSEIRRTKVSPDQEPHAAERARALRDAIRMLTEATKRGDAPSSVGAAFVAIDLVALRSSRPRSARADASAEVNLGVLRSSLGVTQVELAGRLGIGQGSVSELERRDDVYVSTLREYIEALGGRLQVVADFTDTTLDPQSSGAVERGLTKGRVESTGRRRSAMTG